MLTETGLTVCAPPYRRDPRPAPLRTIEALIEALQRPYGSALRRVARSARPTGTFEAEKGSIRQENKCPALSAVPHRGSVGPRRSVGNTKVAFRTIRKELCDC
jgi:hypothetical protein